METLWAFGCSHTAGHSLSTEWSQERMINWYNTEMKCKDFSDFWSRSNKFIETEYNKWKNVAFKNISDDDLAHYGANISFAGQVATKLNLEYECLAYPGTGMDFSYAQFIDNMYRFQKDDIILFELPPTYRYISPSNKKVQLASITEKKELNIVPSDRTLEDIYSLMFKEICCKNINNLYFINVYLDDSNQINEDLENIYWDNKITLGNMSAAHNIVRMPSSHFHQDAHDIFSDYLIREVIK